MDSLLFLSCLPGAVFPDLPAPIPKEDYGKSAVEFFPFALLTPESALRLRVYVAAVAFASDHLHGGKHITYGPSV